MITETRSNGLLFYKSDLLTIPHAMFSRHGGKSTGLFSSLNCSYNVGDAPSLVAANRELMRTTVGAQTLQAVTQVHGSSVLMVKSADQVTETEQRDSMVTDVSGVGLLIQQADCQAVLLHDPVKGVIGAVHSGWRGSVANIIGGTIKCMQQNYGVRPSDIAAVISPSLGPCCGEFVNYHTELPPDFLTFKTTKNHFDFQAISRMQLIDAGVRENRIDTVTRCTVCNEDFFSYRRAVRRGEEKTGRNGSIIVLA